MITSCIKKVVTPTLTRYKDGIGGDNPDFATSYWSTAGGEKVLRLRGDYLSDDEPMAEFWKSRPREATGFRSYRYHPPGTAA